MPAPTPRPLPALVFDLDGTLVDSAPDLQHALNAVLASRSRRGLELLEVKRMVGSGARVLLQRAFAATGSPLPEPALDEELGRFLDLYARVSTRTTRPWPGVVETLEALREAGYPMGMCTNKPHDPTLDLLRDLDLHRFFPVVVGGDHLPFHKPDPRHLLAVMADLGAARAVMVGDDVVDVETARNAGVPVVVVTMGYAKVPHATLGADALLDDYRDLPRIVASLT